MKANEPPIIVEQSFDAAAETVWKAITELDRMVLWYFDNIPAFKAEVGFETQFNIHNEGRDFLHQWKISKVVPYKIIAYIWTFEEYEGEAEVSFELTEVNNQTKLALTNTILKDFTEGIPEFTRASCIGGWEYFIQGQLKEYVESSQQSS